MNPCFIGITRYTEDEIARMTPQQREHAQLLILEPWIAKRERQAGERGLVTPPQRRVGRVGRPVTHGHYAEQRTA